MSPFKDRVIAIVRMIPEGKVVSYGQVAIYAGLPRAARQVGWILNGTEGKVDLPWWRVINREGRITIDGTKFHSKQLQKKLLETEGIEVSEELLVSMEEYRWILPAEMVKKLQLPDEYIQMLIEKYL